MTTAAERLVAPVWQAAVAGGLAERCEVNGRVFYGIYERRDDDVLDDLARSAGHRLTALAAGLEIEAGDEVRIGDRWFVVRDAAPAADGAEIVMALTEAA